MILKISTNHDLIAKEINILRKIHTNGTSEDQVIENIPEILDFGIVILK